MVVVAPSSRRGPLLFDVVVLAPRIPPNDKSAILPTRAEMSVIVWRTKHRSSPDVQTRSNWYRSGGFPSCHAQTQHISVGYVIRQAHCRN